MAQRKKTFRFGVVILVLGVIGVLLLLHSIHLHDDADRAHAASRARALQQLKLLDAHSEENGNMALMSDLAPQINITDEIKAPAITQASAITNSEKFVLNMQQLPLQLDACPVPELHPAKFAESMGWGIRKEFPKCGSDAPPFSSLLEHGTLAEIVFSGDCKRKGVVWEFDELLDSDFQRLTSTYDAEERQNRLKERYSIEGLSQDAAPPPFVVTAKHPDVNGRVTDLSYPYLIARCNGLSELYVRAPLPDEKRGGPSRGARAQRKIKVGARGAELRPNKPPDVIMEGGEEVHHGFSELPEQEAPHDEKDHVDKAVAQAHGLKNILHIMFDSTSIHAQRRAAKQINQFLEQLSNAEQGPSYVFPFLHHHSVSCCSPGNQIPMYSGNMNGEGDPFINAEPFPHSKDWIWNIATERGFETFWSIDNCPDKSARDYHAYPTVDSRVVAPVCLAGVLLSHKALGCVGGKSIDEIVLEGLESFWSRNEVQRKFAMAHFISPHEPTEKLLIELDDLVAKYLRHLEATNVLKDTAIILWSDHGINFGSYASTHDGEIEKLFPFANVILPRTFAESSGMIPALRHNMHRLTTPYDMYELTRRLLYYPARPPKFRHDPNNPRLPSPAESHIMASFQKPITPVDVSVYKLPDTRDCLSANIPVEFCTCLPWITSDDSLRANFFATKAIAEHNRILAPYVRVCNEITLEKIVSFETQKWPVDYQPKEKTSAKRMWAKPDRDMVRIVYQSASPGKGTFIAVFSVSQKDSDNIEIARIERLDAMGPPCGVTDKIPEHLCVCK